MKLPRLFHLIDSAIPTGGFAYSYGMESAVAAGFLKNSGSLKNYLYTFLQQTASVELPFVYSIFICDNQAMETCIGEMVEEYEAMILVPSIQKASIAQGKNWFKLLLSFYPGAELHLIEELFSSRKLPFYFTFAFTLSLKKIGLTLEEIQSMLLHMALRDQVSAAIRLGVLGPMEGHKVQHQFYDFFEQIISRVSGMSYRSACKSAYLLEVFQSSHHSVYSKLFQN